MKNRNKEKILVRVNVALTEYHYNHLFNQFDHAMVEKVLTKFSDEQKSVTKTGYLKILKRLENESKSR